MTSDLPSPPLQSAPPLVSPRPSKVSPLRVLLGVIMPILASLLVTLELQMTNASLKDIQGALGFSADEASWASIAYLSTELISIPLAGYLSRAFSRRWFLSVSLVLFCGLSLACSFAWDLPSFAVLRSLQGFVAGGLLVSAFTIAITQMPRSKQHLGLVMVGIASSLPVAIAQLLAGWLIDIYCWQAIYYLITLLSVLLLPQFWKWLDPQPMRLSSLRHIDWIGWMLLAVALTSLVIVLQRGNVHNWLDSGWIVNLMLLSLITLGIFCVWELWVSNPLINLRLLGERNFAIANMLNLSVGLVLAYAYILPQYLGKIQGYSTLQIGAVLIWGAVVNPVVPKLIEHLEARLVMAIGLGIFLISCWMNTTLSYANSGEQFVTSQIIRAIGQPVLVVAVSFIATANVQQSQAESVSVLFNLIRVVGATMGTAILGTLLTRREHYHFDHITQAVSIANLQTQDRLQQINQVFINKLGDPNAAQMQAVAAIGQTIRREANIMAYSDCFYFIGVGLFLVSFLILFLKRSSKPGEQIH